MAEVTNLPSVEIDLDGFPIVDSSNVVTPLESSVFKRESDPLNFSNPTVVSTTETTTETPQITEPQVSVTDALDAIVKEDNVDTTLDLEKPTLTGKPKVDKSAMVEYLKAKIESNEFVTFDDYDEKVPLEEYLQTLPNKDLNALADENLKLKENKIKEDVPRQFYEMLPEDFKVAFEYIQNGGRDLKGLYKTLGEVQEIRELDSSKEEHHELIASEYLQNANPDWTSDEIKEQVSEWKDLGVLPKKAEQLKPKLDRIKEQSVQIQLQEQAEFARQRQEAAQAYVQNVYEALKPAELNGIKLDQKTQSNLYNGLVNANYKSVSGGNTNKLGHLLEKYQYQEPNYAKIAKVLWLLEDEQGYENALIQKGKNINTEETIRKLKTEQGNRSSSVAFDDGGNSSRVIKNSIPRSTSPFKRA